jgi:hypothetical protein
MTLKVERESKVIKLKLPRIQLERNFEQIELKVRFPISISAVNFHFAKDSIASF